MSIILQSIDVDQLRLFLLVVLSLTQVTSVSVCGVGLRRLSCLDHLPHLRWLSLADNALTSIEVRHLA